MKQGYFENYTTTQREIWVKREDSLLEFKIWFIYSFKFIGDSENKIIDFLNNEYERYDWTKTSDSDLLQNLSSKYSDLHTKNLNLPPRLYAIAEDELDNIDTKIFRKGNLIFGDSVGGISPNKPNSHNKSYKSQLLSQDTILFSPGVLARIIIEKEDKNHYIFQLAEKNLRKKGEVFYKPVGGHIKATSDKYDSLIKTFELIPKERKEIQDVNDVSFFIKTEYFDNFITLFLNDIFIDNNFFYFENPEISILRELFEELGPIYSSDGIDLLSNEDLIKLHDDKIS
jgi:hypothetical protein